MTKVFVEPIGVTVEASRDESLLDALTAAHVEVPTTCGGRGTCGKCLVRLGAGELSPPSEVERQKIPAERLAQGWRLACQAQPLSARVSIEVRGHGGRRQLLTASQLHHGTAAPAVSKQVVTFRKPALDDTRSDVERIQAALPGAEVPYHILQTLPDVLRRHGWRASVVRYGRRIIDVDDPDADDGLYGAAVDIGTSKIVSYLFDLRRGELLDQEALENPQMRYGEDVISRIAQADDGLRQEIAAAARDGVNETLTRLCARQHIEARHIYDLTIVGNTAMHHLVLGVPAQGLGQAPYAPVVAGPLLLRAADLGLAVNPEAGVYLPPPIAGFVGSDALAVAAATHLALKRKPAMAIDIGTNTEISLAVGGKVTVTSCASGPAFEGYQIRHGMKAVEGAIEKVAIGADGHPTTIETIAGVPPVGMCGSGVVDVLAGLVRAGVVDRSGRMQEHPLVRERAGGREYVLTRGPNGDIVFTQHDVRALQLAKAAIATGWALLLRRLAIGVADLEHVYVAGAFGNYLDLDAAQQLGLFPPVARGRVAFVGNAAGVGAQMALIDVRARRSMERLRARMGFLELATDSEFLAAFSDRLGF